MGYLNLAHTPNQTQQDPPKHLTPEQMRSFLASKNGMGQNLQHFAEGGVTRGSLGGSPLPPRSPEAQNTPAPQQGANQVSGLADVAVPFGAVGSANNGGMGAGMQQPGGAPNTGQHGGGLYAQDPGWLGQIHNGLTSVLFGAPNQYQAQGANLQQGYSEGQVGQSLGNTFNGIDQQGQLNQQLAGANGVANQSNVYNQLQGVASGTGPNPAMAQLNQQTGNNVANQAALMAGQRGSGANAGLIARQAANAGSNVQQQATGQAATLQAQQSMNAMGQMGNIAGQQVSQQQAGLNAFNQASQGQSGQLLNAQNAYNQNSVAMQSNLNNVNSGVAKDNHDKDGGIFGGIGSLFHAKGGMIKGYADGGMTEGFTPGAAEDSFGSLPFSNSGEGSAAAAHLLGTGTNASAQPQQTIGYGQLKEAAQPADWITAMNQPKKGGGILGGIMSMAALLSKGGDVNPLDGEAYAQSGMTVPGSANVSGDSQKNDTVPAMLSPGEIIVPRSHAMDPQKAASFAYAVAMKNSKGMK